MRTNAGRDLQARTMGNSLATGAGTGAMAPADYIGVSASNTSPSASLTDLPGEISSGSLARSKATYAHTNGQATYTLTKTLTSNQSVTLRTLGIFNAASGGTMMFINTITPAVELVSGDQISITVTVTL